MLKHTCYFLFLFALLAGSAYGKVFACGLGSSNQCRAPAGDCDNGGYCRGLAISCPGSTYKPAGTVCRKSTSACDPQEVCTGNSPTCPSDITCPPTTTGKPAEAPAPPTPLPSTAVPAACPAGSKAKCREPAGACDNGGFCTGAYSLTCPASTMKSSGTVCRNSTGICDLAERCTGTSPTCPSDVFLPNTSICRASAGVCDPPEMCTGTAGSCPPDIFSVKGTVCRLAAGACDAPETCDGLSAACPPDKLLPNGTVCRPPSQICDPAEMCDGAKNQCPLDKNPLCPWALLPSSGKPSLLTPGQYCGTLSDNSTAVMKVMWDWKVYLSVTTRDDRLLPFLMESFIDDALSAPILNSQSLIRVAPWQNVNVSQFKYIQLIGFDASSVVINFNFVRPPLVNKSQAVKLSAAACQGWALPAGNYSGTSHHTNGLLQVFPRTNATSAQLAMFFVSSASTEPFQMSLALKFIAMNSVTGDVVFEFSNEMTEKLQLRIVFRNIGTTSEGYKFVIFPRQGVITLEMLRARKDVPSLPAGVNCQLFPQKGSTSSSFLCITVTSPTTVRIDLTVAAAMYCTNVTATFTRPLFTVDPLPDCLDAARIHGIQLNFSSGLFVGFSSTASPAKPGCLSTSPMLCASFRDGSYATYYGGNAVQLLGYSYNSKKDYGLQNFVPLDCTNLSNAAYQLSSIPPIVQVSFSSTKATGLADSLTKGTQFSLTASNCYEPKQPLARFGGSVTFKPQNANVAALYTASMIVSRTASYLVDSFCDIVFKISNSTSLLCTFASRGVLVVGGTVIFDDPPAGTCDGQRKTLKNPDATVSADLSTSGGVVTLKVGGKNVFSGLSVGVTETSDTVPSGRYCADLGAGDFVMIQENTNRTTTIYASIDGELHQSTRWLDIFNQGKTIVTRRTDANGTKVLPFTLANFSSSGYGLLISTKRFVTARAETCNAFAPGQFCGVSNATAWHMSNTSFASLSLAFDPTTQLYTTSLFASRRASTSRLNVVFEDHPWLLQFSRKFPARVSFNKSSSTWTVQLNDSLGAMTIPSMTSSKCGTPLAANMYCGTPQGRVDLQAFVIITSRSGDGSISMTVSLLNTTNRTITRITTAASAFIIESKLMYWAGPTLPDVLVANVSGSELTLAGRYPGTLSSSFKCSSIPSIDQYYCGMNGAAPWTLVAKVNRDPSFWIGAGLGNGFSRLTTSWLLPMGMGGELAISSNTDPTDPPDPFSITWMQYFSSNDTFVLTATDNATMKGVVVSLTRGTCSVVIPDGQYCAYNDTTGSIGLQITVSNRMIFTRLPQSPFRLQCIGGQTPVGGLYDCFTPGRSYYHDVNSYLNYPVLSFQEQIMVSYSNSLGLIKATFSSNGVTYYAMKGSCDNAQAAKDDIKFSNNTRLAVNASGAVFVADVDRHCIFTVDPSSGFVSNFAGQCNSGGYQDGNRKDAKFNRPVGIVFDATGTTLFVLDAGNARIRAVTNDGTVSTVSGNGDPASVDGAGAQVSFLDLAGVTLHPTSGCLYVSEAYRIRLFNQTSNAVETYVGSTSAGYTNDTRTKAMLNRPGKGAFTADGLTMYFVDSGNKCLRKVGVTGNVETVAGAAQGIGAGFLSGIMPGQPQPSLFDFTTGNVVIIDNGLLWIYAASSSGAVKSFRGPNALLLRNGTDVAASSDSVLYIAEGDRIRALFR